MAREFSAADEAELKRLCDAFDGSFEAEDWEPVERILDGMWDVFEPLLFDV